MPSEKYYSACALNCPDICAYEIEVEDGKIVRLKGDQNHPYTLGRACPKGYAHVLRTYSEDRLKHPMRKSGDGGFERISWETAIEEIALKIQEAKASYGPTSVGIYSGSGNDGMAPRYAARFANVLGCRMIPGIVEICFEGAYEGARFNVGPFPPHELEDWANSKCIVIWGTNKHESGIHAKRVIDKAIDNGAKLIVIDPRRIPYAATADIYTTIRPGTDGALALGLANEIIRKNLYDADFIKKHVVGFEEYKARVSEYDKKRVSELTWVDVNTIENIAKTFAGHGPALIMTAPAGMNHYTNGSWAARAVHSFLAICGYLGVSGGGFQYLSSDFSPFNSASIRLDHLLPQEVKPIVPSGTYLPRYILEKDGSPLKVFIIQAANPVTQWPNTNKTMKALASIPFKASIDLEMTDTARLCDIVLPATFIFEHHNLVHSELHRIVQYAPKIIEPVGEAKSELYIWRDIALKLGFGQFFEIDELDAIRLALDSEDCRHFTLEDLIKQPHGIRTSSPAIPFSNKAFKTPSGKVELRSLQLEAMGFDPLPFHEEPVESPISTPEIAERYPLIMITGRLHTRLHSQYGTNKVGGAVTSYSDCTTCRKCVEECPDEAISLVKPSIDEITKKSRKPSSAPMRETLARVISHLAIKESDKRINIPEEYTLLLVPEWDKKRCIGCRDCELDICPYGVITETLSMPSRKTVQTRSAVLTLHPETAQRLGLKRNELVRIESQRGIIDPMILELSNSVDPRVAWASDGWWNSEGNVNLLTEDRHTAFGHTPGFNSVLVRVGKSKQQGRKDLQIKEQNFLPLEKSF